jgi:membrane protein DedA with SNARE-associated domain
MVIPIVATTVAGAAGNAFLPTLSTRHPLALIALDGRNRQLLLAAHRVAFGAFMVVAVMRKFASDPSFYALGRHYGAAAVGWVDRRSAGAAGSVRLVERAFRHAAVPLVALWSGAVVCTLAGATEMNPALFFSADLVGSALEVYGVWIVAAHLHGVLSGIIRFFGANEWWLTAITASVALATLAWQWRTGPARLAALDELSQATESEGAEQATVRGRAGRPGRR